MFECLKKLEIKQVYACGYEIPVVSDNIEFDEASIVDYGRCKMHVSVPRVFKKTKTKCLQNHLDGKLEWFHPIDEECSIWTTIKHERSSILSINIKEEERQELRRTMNTFMLDVQKGEASGNWLDNKKLRKEKVFSDRNEGKSINIIGEVYE